MFSRKINLNSEEVLTAIESMVGKIPSGILFTFRYRQPSYILRSNLSHIKASVREFLYSFSKDTVSYYPLSKGECSLSQPVLFLTPIRSRRSGRKRNLYSLRIYSPAYTGLTAEIDDLNLLEPFKDELKFFQNGEETDFESLNTFTDVVAVSEHKAPMPCSNLEARLIIHYVPVSE